MRSGTVLDLGPGLVVGHDPILIPLFSVDERIGDVVANGLCGPARRNPRESLSYGRLEVKLSEKDMQKATGPAVDPVRLRVGCLVASVAHRRVAALGQKCWPQGQLKEGTPLNRLARANFAHGFLGARLCGPAWARRAADARRGRLLPPRLTGVDC
jgi:hypothetical protein